MTKTNQKIPEGWSVKKLGNITTLLTNGFVGSATPHYTEDENGIIYIQGFNVKTNSFDLTGIKKVTPDFHKKNAKSCLQEGDLLTVQTGDIGVTARVPKCLAGSNCHALIISRFDKTICDSKFYLHYYNSSICQSRFKKIETGSTMKHINVGDLETECVPVPPLPEQEKIAEILGCWDDGIEKLSRLIEQKKRLKKGLMQRLLTGKQRLPGFSAPWKKVKLGEITDQISKSVGNLKIQTASISAKIGFVPQTEKFGRDISGEQYSKYTLIEKGDFSYNKGNSKTYPQGCAYRLKDFEKIAVPNVFISFKAKEDILYPEFIEQFFIGNFHGRLLRKVITSSVRDNGLLNLNVKDFFGIPIYLPPLSEQKAIADILSKADEEITLLTEKLSALKSQKKGLMQKLLTGQIRVKIN